VGTLRHRLINAPRLGAGPSPLSESWVVAHRRALLLAGVVVLGLVVVMRAWLDLVGPMPGDVAAADWFVTWSPGRSLSPDLDSLLDVFDDLATPYVAALTVAAAAAVVWEARGWRWAVLVPASAAVVVPNAVLKHLFGPTPVYAEQGFNGINFPSGHVTYTTALFGLLAWLAFTRGRRAAGAICLALVVVMGPARVLGGVHLPSDVVAGYGVGLAWLAAVLAIGVPWAGADARR
jgi:membrane-associated phospholipid phosphatase